MDWEHIQIVFGTIATIAIALSLFWAVKKRGRDYVMVAECEKMRCFCMKEKDELKVERNVVGRLEAIVIQLESELVSNKQLMKKMIEETKVVFSHIGDMKTILSLMVSEQMADSPNIKLIQDLLKRKSHE